MARPLYMDASMLELERLLDAIDSGELAVPDFQREFVWSDQHVKSLLGTVFNAWPAGSLLLVRGDFHQFRLRPLDGAPSISKVRYVVLDGQQRLTALYNALRDTGPSVYAIDLSSIGEESAEDLNIEERMRSIKRDDWERELSNPHAQLRKQLLPLAALGTPASYFEWRDQVLYSDESEDSESLRQSLTDFYRERLAGIHRYSFPTVYLDSSLNVSAIAGIFEKVNRSGLQLGTFDLMVARAYDATWNLRDEWESAQLDSPLVRSFLDADGMPVLQAIALRRKLNVRQSAVLEMRNEVREDWLRAVDSTRQAIEVVTSACGVLSREWLPYNVLLVGLTALAMSGRRLSDPDIQRWYWTRAFSGGFDVAANTRIVADYQRLTKGESIADAPPIAAETLTTATRRTQRALWAAFLGALASTGAGDVLGYPIEIERDRDRFSPQGRPPNVVSVFPRDLSPAYGETPLHLRTLGLALTTSRSAALIRRLGFAGAVAHASRELGESTVAAALTAQWLPSVEELEMHNGEIPWLLGWRATRLTEWLMRWDVRVVQSEDDGD